MRISRTVPVARGLAVLCAGLGVADVSAQTIAPVQAQTIEPVHAQPVEPVEAQSIEPYRAETVDPYTAEAVRPFEAEAVEPDVTLETAGDLQFEPPAGWKRVVKERILLFGPPQLKRGTFAALILLPSEAVPGDPVRWLNGWLRTMGQGETELARGTLHDEHTTGGRQLAIVVQTRTADGTVHYRLYRALQSNGRGYLFLFDVSSLELMQEHLGVVTRFARHLHVPGSAGSVVSAGTRLGDLRGTIPAGWQREDGPGGSTLTLGGLPAGQTVKLMVFAPQALPDGFNAWFLDLVDADLRGRTVVQRGAVELGRTGGLETLQALVFGRGDDGDVAWDLLRGYRLGDRGQLLIYRASSQALYDRYLPVARGFLDQVVRWDAPAPAPPQPAIPQGFDSRLVGTWLAYIPGTFTPNPNGPGGKVGFGGPLGILRIDAKGHYAWYKQGNRVLQGELSPYNPPDRRRGDVHRYYSISDGTWEMYVTYSEDDGLLSFANQRGGLYAMSAKRSN